MHRPEHQRAAFRARARSTADAAVPQQCTNPSCCMPFDLRQGQLYQFEIRSRAVSCGDAAREVTSREMAHFWLCGRCSANMVLVLNPEIGVELQELDPPAELLADA